MLTSTWPLELFRPMTMRFCRMRYSSSRPSNLAITPVTSWSGAHCTLVGLPGIDLSACSVQSVSDMAAPRVVRRRTWAVVNSRCRRLPRTRAHRREPKDESGDGGGVGATASVRRCVFSRRSARARAGHHTRNESRETNRRTRKQHTDGDRRSERQRAVRYVVEWFFDIITRRLPYAGRRLFWNANDDDDGDEKTYTHTHSRQGTCASANRPCVCARVCVRVGV